MQVPCREGNTVLVLTPSYHWVGRIVGVTPFTLILDDAMMFVEVGQIEDACQGRWRNAHGDPIPSGQLVEVPRPPSSQVIEYRGELPRERISG